MNFLVIGLGSMGKRRVRNLIALGYKDNIAGFEPREDRRSEAERKYNIKTYDSLEKAMSEFNPDVFIVSTPPNMHMHYAYLAEKNNINCFIEASVVEAEKILELSKRIKNKKILIAPSCTMKYYPISIKIKELISKKVLGKILNYNYQTGQYLPDWHPWEKIEDFYVSNPDTGGCREIVPFELTWLNDIFGDSRPLACVRKKVTDINADIDDIYHCILEHSNNVLGNLTIEVVSRPKATREMRILGSDGEMFYSADSNELRYINTDMNDWERIKFDAGTVENGYINPEEPYINELKDYINDIKKVKNGEVSTYPNRLEDDYKILQTLYRLEEISEGRHDLSR